jgi:hypothetical protein
MYNGTAVVGFIRWTGPWFSLALGQKIHFNRHGSFRVVKVNKKSVHLEITSPRKKWNPAGKQIHTVKIGIGIQLTVVHNQIHLMPLHSGEHTKFTPKGRWAMHSKA